MKNIAIILLSIFISGCALKEPIKSQSATILLKTSNMKFYDKGFITKYDDRIHLQIFSVGQLVLNLEVYKDRVCRSTFECLNASEFNKKFLSDSYRESFLYDLLSKEKVDFKDRDKRIKIKVK
jgi:hypothetical protein